MKLKQLVVFFCLLTGLFSACYYPTPDYSRWDLPQETRDSLQFVEEHQYTINYNFLVVADSLELLTDSMSQKGLLGSEDTLQVVRKGDLLVVAAYNIDPQDSIDSVSVEVARDQNTMGWVHEKDLLQSVTPDDPISQFIHYFDNFNTIVFLLLVVLAVMFYLFRLSRKKPLIIVHFNDIDSPYPTLLCLLVAGAAVFYGSIQHFVPMTWVHFYYYPTLNPFALPWGMRCFLVCVWGIILLLIAVLDEVIRRLSFTDAVTYLLGLGGICMLCYMFFSVTTPYYIGYLCYALYVVFAWGKYLQFRHYRCGNCGAELPSKHCQCPKCGALNS